MSRDASDFRAKHQQLRDAALDNIPRAHAFREWHAQGIYATLNYISDELLAQGLRLEDVPEFVRLSFADPSDSRVGARCLKRPQRWAYDWLQNRAVDQGPMRIRFRVEPRGMQRLQGLTRLQVRSERI